MDKTLPRYSLKRGDAFRFLSFPHSAKQVPAFIAVIIR